MQKENVRQIVSKAVIEAGQAILALQGAFQVSPKADGSPVTTADEAAHHILSQRLSPLELRFISEEGGAEELSSPLDPHNYAWLVDPLDGTQHFIEGTGDFTVNVGLVYQNRPVMGFIYFPKTDEFYYGEVAHSGSLFAQPFENCAFKGRGVDLDKTVMTHLTPRPFPMTHPKVLVSPPYHKRKEEVISYIPTIESPDIHMCIGSLKFCCLAEGEADLYVQPRLTYEWDTAAGDALLCAVGGNVLTLEGQPLLYGKKGWKNPPFIAKTS